MARRRPRLLPRTRFPPLGHQVRPCLPAHRPAQGKRSGNATSEQDRYAQIARLLHEDTIDLTDRVAGAQLLLYGRQLSRITAITTDQVTTVREQVFIRFGRADALLPEPLACLIQTHLREGRRYVGVGAMAITN